MTSAELEVNSYCFKDDLEHPETNVTYSMNSATDSFLKIAVVYSSVKRHSNKWHSNKSQENKFPRTVTPWVLVQKLSSSIFQ